MGTLALSLLLGYLLGSVPFAVIVAKAFGLRDPRTFGSGNPGATNVLRTGHRLAAALTLLGDAGKGLCALWLSSALGASADVSAWAGFAAFLGHLYPVFLRFRGGKGVATALGVLAGLQPLIALAVALLWIAVALISRYSSLAALGAAALAPLLAFAWAGFSSPTAVVVAMAALLIWRHRSNIRRLLAGTESRIGEKNATQGRK
ncbi:MAG: glycerol-3-phosphate 1-O-acyltransferase PlsY [Rhodocyclaceae bacterium]|nr:glycerol-3-phosphate 1-O-acyltransferase PlsY [Rhodocyclaceae bacterium]